MKPITYWEAKLDGARARLQTLGSLGIEKPRNPPPRRVLREKWPEAMSRWRAAHRRYQQRLRDVAKLQARIIYFEARIEATTPTFWERL